MPDQDLMQDLRHAVQDGIRKGVQDKLTGYNSPIDKLLAEVISDQGSQIRTLLTEAIASALADTQWRDAITDAVRSKLASTLIGRFGGEIERQVNALKSDPATRARITLAIDGVVAASMK